MNEQANGGTYQDMSLDGYNYKAFASNLLCYTTILQPYYQEVILRKANKTVRNVNFYFFQSDFQEPKSIHGLHISSPFE